MLTDDMKRLVREQRLGFIATVCPDGTPNLSPKGTTTVWDDEHLVFADISSPGTVRNLEQNPSIEINVVDPIVRKGYRFKGTASVLRSGAQYDELMAFYESLIDRAPQRIRSIVLVRVEQALPVISPAYEPGVAEDDVRANWQRYWQELGEGRGGASD